MRNPGANHISTSQRITQFQPWLPTGILQAPTSCQATAAALEGYTAPHHDSVTFTAMVFSAPEMASHFVHDRYLYLPTVGLAILSSVGAKSEFRQELKYHPTNGLAKMQIDRMEKARSTARSSAKSTSKPVKQRFTRKINE
jgi:hypothetical protein